MITQGPSPAMQRRLDELLDQVGPPSAQWPEITGDLVRFLEELYAPRCLAPDEMVEDHLRYAGAVALVADMRYHYEQQLADTEEYVIRESEGPLARMAVQQNIRRYRE